MRTIAIAMVLGVVSLACASGNEGEPQATPEGEAKTTVAVTLQEWSVAPKESSAPAGEITFDVKNIGKMSHEFMVIRTELDLTELPAKKDGSLDDEGEGVEVVDAMNAMEHTGEMHAEIEPGDEKEFEYNLDDGKYVLVCNLVEEEEDETNVHFKLGMRIPFTVE